LQSWTCCSEFQHPSVFQQFWANHYSAHSACWWYLWEIKDPVVIILENAGDFGANFLASHGFVSKSAWSVRYFVEDNGNWGVHGWTARAVPERELEVPKIGPRIHSYFQGYARKIGSCEVKIH